MQEQVRQPVRRSQQDTSVKTWLPWTKTHGAVMTVLQIKCKWLNLQWARLVRPDLRGQIGGTDIKAHFFSFLLCSLSGEELMAVSLGPIFGP